MEKIISEKHAMVTFSLKKSTLLFILNAFWKTNNSLHLLVYEVHSQKTRKVSTKFVNADLLNTLA